ncbi:hypothetical protein C1J02_18900 [Sulfitobacter sp. SK011]|nr:hypothetical protein C1J02_18900 [Sulfitobacter sp. SK011]
MCERGEAQFYRSAGRDMHAAEGQICRLPNLHAGGIGRKYGPPNVMSAHEVDIVGLAIDHRHRHTVMPNVFLQQGRGTSRVVDLVLRQPVAILVVDHMDAIPRLRQAAVDLRIAGVVGLHHLRHGNQVFGPIKAALSLTSQYKIPKTAPRCVQEIE